MNDVQLLFVVLAALYLWECACWLRRGSVAFVTWLGRDWRAVHPGALAGNPNGGFILAAPLPPLGSVFIANQLPLSLSPDGVLAFVATNVNPGWRPAQSGGFARWEKLGAVRVRGKKLLVNGELFLVAATSGLARHLKAELQRLAKLTPAERETAIIGMLRGTLDLRAIESRQREYQSRSPAVRRLSNALFGYLLLVVPGLIWYFGFGLTWVGRRSVCWRSRLPPRHFFTVPIARFILTPATNASRSPSLSPSRRARPCARTTRCRGRYWRTSIRWPSQNNSCRTRNFGCSRVECCWIFAILRGHGESANSRRGSRRKRIPDMPCCQRWKNFSTRMAWRRTSWVGPRRLLMIRAAASVRVAMRSSPP